jgi:hypothetical protein
VLRTKATEEVLSAELRSQLYVAFDIDYLDQQKFRELWIRAEEVGRILARFELPFEGKSKLTSPNGDLVLGTHRSVLSSRLPVTYKAC